MRARLTLESGDCEPSAIELQPGQAVTIGRSRENSLVIRDDLVSRLHAKVFFEDGKWMIRDFGLNGTRIQNQRITGAVELKEGFEVAIGLVTFRFSFSTQPFSVPGKVVSASAKSTDRSPTPHPIELRATQTTQNHPRELPAESLTNFPGAVLTEVTSGDDTDLRLDEFSALCQYMTTAISTSDPIELLRLTLRTLLGQTAATFVGYLNLDPSDPSPKITYPERASLDFQLSRHLTERVRETRRLLWLFGDERENWNQVSSLTSITDAVCVPVHGGDFEPVAAVHVYKSGKGFNERDVKFIEAVSRFLTPALENLRNRRKLEAENLRLRGAVQAAEELIGDSSAMMALRQQIGRAAPLPFTALITGESGAGKELVALALHQNSPRASGPLVVVNCASMTPALLEAELFGYRKGAFAGADRDHPGMFEQADEGTLFLDEVADLSLECQAKLLRVIEGKPFRPVGGNRDIVVDVRVVAASNRELETEVKAGRFRQDLLFRLKVITIRVPPLRDHAEDIIELARFFLERLSVQCRRTFRLTAAAERKLFSYSWPGNVRQLRAVLESAAVMTDSETIDADSLPLSGTSEQIAQVVQMTAAADAPASLDIDDLETWAIVKALKQTAGNVSQAARVLGISRDTLHTKLKKKNIDRESVATPTHHGGDTVSP